MKGSCEITIDKWVIKIEKGNWFKFPKSRYEFKAIGEYVFEYVAVYKLPEDFQMENTFSVRDRIKISEKYHWPKNATGEIGQPPKYIVEMPEGWKGIVREVNSLKGILLFYWVKFDEPQIDADGDSPYQEAEIDSNFILLN